MELYIPTLTTPTIRNPKTGRFNKGYRRKTPPANKGRRMEEYTTEETRTKILANINGEGRKAGNRAIRKKYGRQVIAIKDGKIVDKFTCAGEAVEEMPQKYGITVQKENIVACCKGKRGRSSHKGFQWYFWDQPEKWEDKVSKSEIYIAD